MSQDVRQEAELTAQTVLYSLPGQQVEPGSAFWTDRGKRIEVVEVDGLPDGVLPPYQRAPADLEADIRELQFLASHRDDDTQVLGGGTFEGRVRAPLSSFLKLRPAPISAIFNVTVEQTMVTDLFAQCNQGAPLVRTGRELARLFENETPGLLHRHALNCLLFRSNISPPRQARIWMALDVTIYSALLAAWHFKWANIDGAGRPDYSRVFRERPIEYELRRAKDTSTPPRFDVLYDKRVNSEGNGDGELRCPNARVISPGTPRHPAYPSGHSTYSAAASAILAYFFPDHETELNHLADNIGVARLWAGVHWRDDHTGGQALGRAVAERVKKQLIDDPVMQLNADMLIPKPCDLKPRPEFSTVRSDGRNIRDPNNPKNPHQDEIPQPQAAIAEFQGSQRGAT